MTTSTAQAEMKKNFVLDRLLAAGVTESQQGEDVRLLDYNHLKWELAIHQCRSVDTDNSSNAWF